MKLSVIIPEFNESRTVVQVIEKVSRVVLAPGLDREMVIVDDGSCDRTRAVLKEYENRPGIKIIYHRTNLGKAAAVRTGLAASDGEMIILQDADLEYDPADFPALLKPLLDNSADAVNGSRFLGSIKNMTQVNRIANRLHNLTAGLLFGTSLTDINSCYKAFNRKVLEKISLDSQNFILETELLVKLTEKGVRIKEVPISYVARSRKEGKKISPVQALEIYWWLLNYRFQKRSHGSAAK